MKPVKITAACITAIALTLPVTAFALSIFNATDAPFTVSINHYCSPAFGKVPVLREMHVDDRAILKMCGQNNDNCVGSIHELEDCTGLEIGSFVLNKEAEVQALPVTQAPGLFNQTYCVHESGSGWQRLAISDYREMILIYFNKFVSLHAA